MDVLPYLTQPCTITHVSYDGDADEYGDPTETTETTELDGAPGCFITPQRRDDNTLRTNQQTEEWLGYFPAGTVLDGSDRVEVAGVTYQVKGPPSSPWNPLDGAVAYVEANLVRVA